MLDSYSKSIKTSVFILALIAIASILWGVFDHRFLADWLFLILLSDIFLILLFLCSKFLLRSQILKPIFKGFLWGLFIPILLCILTALAYIATESQKSGLSMGPHYGGILFEIIFGILGYLSLSLSLIIGASISYKNSKNLIVFIFLILLIAQLLAIVAYGFFYVKAVYRI